MFLSGTLNHFFLSPQRLSSTWKRQLKQFHVFFSHARSFSSLAKQSAEWFERSGEHLDHFVPPLYFIVAPASEPSRALDVGLPSRQSLLHSIAVTAISAQKR
jgi:hypothetical protein